jgi:hypothetical protein
VDAQMKFYKTMALRRGCETWVMVSRDKSRLQAAEMRFLRSVIGTTIRDTITDYDSGSKLCIESLNATVKNIER